MNTYLRRGLMGVWIFFAASFLTRWLLTDLVVQTKFPESFWVWLDNILDVHNVEAQVDLEIFLALSFSLAFVSFLTWLCLFSYRRFQSKNFVKKCHLGN